jgi:hypothetical protein
MPEDETWREYLRVYHQQFRPDGSPLGELEPKRWQRTKGDPLWALVNREPTGRGGDPRWHVSVSAQNRVPTWEEMVETVHALRPGVPFVLGIPPRSWWLNVHPHVLHAWETFDAELVEEWKRNAQKGQVST